MEKSYYICTERLNWTAQFTQKMEELNQSSLILGPVSARVAGFITIPFVSLAETLVHGGATVVKGLTGLIVSPWNCIADTLCPDCSLPQTLEFSSALAHFYLVIESICTAVLLPFLCLLNPSRANALINARTAKAQENIENEADIEIDPNVEQLNPEIVDSQKLIRAKERGKKRVAEKDKLLQAAQADITRLNNERNELTGRLNNIPMVDNTALINRIAELETNLKESKIREDASIYQYESLKNSQLTKDNSKFEDNQDQQKIPPIKPNSALGLGDSSNTTMKKGSGRGTPTPEQLKRAEEAKQRNALPENRQPKNNESPRKKIIPPTNSGAALSMDQLQNVKLRSTSSLSQSKLQSPQTLTNSQTAGLNSSTNNFSLSRSDSIQSLFESGFVNYEKQNDPTNGEINHTFEGFKQSCNDLHNQIKELEMGKFLPAHESYLNKMSSSINMNQILPSVKENVERLERWIEACENKEIWQEPIDFSKSMIASGINADSNNLNNSTAEELKAVINYFKSFKTALQDILRGKQNSAGDSEEIQKQKRDLEESNREARIEQFEERKKDLLRPLEFEFDIESCKAGVKWKACFRDNAPFLNDEEFITSLNNVVKAINESQLEGNKVDEDKEYLRLKDMVNFMNRTFAKTARK